MRQQLLQRGEIRRALLVRPHVAHLHLAGGQLVGTQHRHDDGAQLVGQLELALQAAMLMIHLADEPRVTASLNERERLRAHRVVHAGHEEVAAPSRGELVARRLQRQRAPLVAQREAEAGRGAPAHLLGQLVVAPSATDGVLAAHTLGHLHFEHRARVVVQAAHQLRILLEGKARAAEVRLHGVVVLAAVVA